MRSSLFFFVGSLLPQASADDTELHAAAARRTAGLIAPTAKEPASRPSHGLVRWPRRAHRANRAADPAHEVNDAELDSRIRRLERAVGSRYY